MAELHVRHPTHERSSNGVGRAARKILFFPDEHLGRNTANKMGMAREQMIVWDPFQPNGGNTEGRDPAGETDFVEGPLQRASDVSAGPCG